MIKTTKFIYPQSRGKSGTEFAHQDPPRGQSQRVLSWALAAPEVKNPIAPSLQNCDDRFQQFEFDLFHKNEQRKKNPLKFSQNLWCLKSPMHNNSTSIFQKEGFRIQTNFQSALKVWGFCFRWRLNKKRNDSKQNHHPTPQKSLGTSFTLNWNCIFTLDGNQWELPVEILPVFSLNISLSKSILNLNLNLNSNIF